jgi:hypothetical protein
MSPQARRLAGRAVILGVDLLAVIVALVGSSLFKTVFILLAAGALTIYVLVMTSD